MRELVKIYNDMKDPLKDHDVLREMLRIRADISDGKISSFYSGISSVFDSTKTDAENTVDSQKRDEFFANYFNEFKRYTLSIPNFGNDQVGSIKSILKNIPDIVNYQQYCRLLNDFPIINKALIHTNVNTFTHVRSSDLGLSNLGDNIEHRLYLNVGLNNIHEIASILKKACDEKGLPYYFKFTSRTRDDAFVIYSDHKHLIDYIELLRELKVKYPVFDNIKTPPILTGKIDSWIGYGCEPKMIKGKRNSYNDIRQKIISSTLDKMGKSIIKENIDKKFKIGTKIYTVRNYILLTVPNAIYEQICAKYANDPSVDKKYLKDTLLKELMRISTSNINKILNDFYTNSNTFKHVLKIGNHNLEITSLDFQAQLNKVSNALFNYDKDFPKHFFNQISNELQKHEFDVEKSCFNSDTLRVLSRLPERKIDKKEPISADLKTIAPIRSDMEVIFDEDAALIAKELEEAIKLEEKKRLEKQKELDAFNQDTVLEEPVMEIPAIEVVNPNEQQIKRSKHLETLRSIPGALKPTVDPTSAFPTLKTVDNSLRERRFTRLIKENKITLNNEYILRHIKEIMVSPILLQTIIRSDDPNILNYFVEYTNLALQNGELTDNDFKLLRSDYILGELFTAQSISNKDNNELTTKLENLSNLVDSETLIKIYTNDYMIGKLFEGKDPMYTNWFKNGTYKRFDNKVLKEVLDKLIQYGDSIYVRELLTEYQLRIYASVDDLEKGRTM